MYRVWSIWIDTGHIMTMKDVPVGGVGCIDVFPYSVYFGRSEDLLERPNARLNRNDGYVLRPEKFSVQF